MEQVDRRGLVTRLLGALTRAEQAADRHESVEPRKAGFDFKSREQAPAYGFVDVKLQKPSGPVTF